VAHGHLPKQKQPWEGKKVGRSKSARKPWQRPITLSDDIGGGQNYLGKGWNKIREEMLYKARQKGYCPTCGLPEEAGGGFSVDHINPRSLGSLGRSGVNKKSNLRVVCSVCKVPKEYGYPWGGKRRRK